MQLDQAVLSLCVHACRGNRPLPDDKQNLFLGYNGELKMGILPVSIFCSGAQAAVSGGRECGMPMHLHTSMHGVA